MLPGDIKKQDDEALKHAAMSARPRRLSEVEIKSQEKPIPEGSSFFIFSQTNWWVYLLYLSSLLSFTLLSLVKKLVIKENLVPV